MGKVEIRRKGIIEYLKNNGNVERKTLWTHFNISETRLCEDIKALKVNGYQFDTSKSGVISLIESTDQSARIYEPITTSILRKWILIAWVSMCSELRIDSYAEKNEHMNQTLVYKNLCSFYDYIFEKNDERKINYTINTFHRDIREACAASELSHSLMKIFKTFEEKDLFRLSSKPFLITMTETLAEKIIFVLNEMNQNNPALISFRKKINAAFSDNNQENIVPIYANMEISNVYDRISILASATSIGKSIVNTEFVAKLTGLPEDQIRKDLNTLCHNNIGRRLFGKNGFRSDAFTANLSRFSNVSALYYGKKKRILYLTMDENMLFNKLKLHSFIRNNSDDTTNSLTYISKRKWYEHMEELWYGRN